MELAGNRQLADLSLRLQLPWIMAQVGDILTPDVLAESVTEHRALASAISACDPVAADAAMRAHLGRAAALALARVERLRGRRRNKNPWQTSPPPCETPFVMA